MAGQDIVLVLRVDDKGTRVVQSFGAKSTAALKGVEGQAAKTGAAMTATSKKLITVGKGMTKFVTLPLLAIGAAALKVSFDFNKAIAEIATLIPGQRDLINEWKNEVQDLAIAYGAGTKDIAGGLYQVVSAGYDTADAINVLDTAVKAAAAGVATTTDAINLL